MVIHLSYLSYGFGFLIFLSMLQTSLAKKIQSPAPFRHSSKVIDCSYGAEGTEDNLIPDCYVTLDFDYHRNAIQMAAKVADINNERIGKGDIDENESVVLANYPWIIQECRNWCGPAALQGVLQFFGIKKSQTQIARLIDAGDCDNRSKITDIVMTPATPEQQNALDRRYRGTCLTDILTHLSKAVKDQLYGADRIDDQLGTLRQVTEMVIERVRRAVKDYGRPIIALINQTPPNPDHHFPGWERSRPNLRKAHYVTLIGYGGNYTGADRTGFFYFRDSSGHNRPPNNTVDVNTLVIDLIANHGRGSCSAQGWNLIW